jgi:hypothetical protein
VENTGWSGWLKRPRVRDNYYLRSTRLWTLCQPTHKRHLCYCLSVSKLEIPKRNSVRFVCQCSVGMKGSIPCCVTSEDQSAIGGTECQRKSQPRKSWTWKLAPLRDPSPELIIQQCYVFLCDLFMTTVLGGISNSRRDFHLLRNSVDIKMPFYACTRRSRKKLDFRQMK